MDALFLSLKMRQIVFDSVSANPKVLGKEQPSFWNPVTHCHGLEMPCNLRGMKGPFLYVSK